MTTEYIAGIHAVQAAIKSSASEISEILLHRNRRDQRLQQIVRLAEKHAIPVTELSRGALNERVGDAQHQGVIAQLRSSSVGLRKNVESYVADLIAKEPLKRLLVLVLDEVQDPHNLGACLRTADAVGVDAVIIPSANSVGLTPVVRKVASGAAETVALFQVPNLQRTLQDLQGLGFWVYGAAGEASVSLFDLDLKGPVAIVMGSEGAGLRRLTRERCDELFQLPMNGTVSSLNVSVAAGITMYEVFRQRR